MSSTGRGLNKEGLRTPDRVQPKASLFTFNKPPTTSPFDSRTAPEFSLQSPLPIRRVKGHSLDLFSPCDNSTIASSRLNSSLLYSSQVHSRSMSGFKDFTPIRGKETPEIEAIRQKLQQQEVRLMTFLKRMKEKEREAEEAKEKCAKLRKECRESTEQVAHLKAVLANYECQIAGLTEKTTNSFERLLHQKNCEIQKLQSDLSMFQDQYAAKVEAEVLAITHGKDLERGQTERLSRELEAANTRIKQLTEKNAALYEEIAGYQFSLNRLKSRTESGNVYVRPTQVSSEDFVELQARLKDVEEMQAAMMEQNCKLKAELAACRDTDKANAAKVATLCGDLFRHRCNIVLFSRVLTAIRDGETFNLTLLLHSKASSQPVQGHSLQSCVEEAKQAIQCFEELETAAVDWYSAQCGDSCRVS